MRRPTGQLESK